jgi:hypothetical protein
MIKFSAKIRRFDAPGGWTYIEISKRHATQLNPGCRKSFRIRGLLDRHEIQKTSLLPTGEGRFMLPINAAMRKGTGKTVGDTLQVQAEVDERPLKLSADLISCLKDEPCAYDFFRTLPKSHQHYFSGWIDSAKTMRTKTKRIAMAVIALSENKGWREMMEMYRGQESGATRLRQGYGGQGSLNEN